METFTDPLSWRHIAATAVIYFATRALYRLFFHPLAQFPGPKAAAISTWFEAYFDVFHNGQYTFKISEMHKQYGPIIRISPHELHISDPAFYDTLYRQDGRWDKYAWSVDAFASKGASLFTANHDLHKARRQTLNPFFSKTKVTSHQNVIRKHIDLLCDRLSNFAVSRKGVDLGAAIAALSRDVANDYILGKSYDSLRKDDFDVSMGIVGQGAGQMWRVSKHIRFVAPTMKAIPVKWMIKVGDKKTKIFFRFLQETMQDTQKLMAAALSANVSTPRTLVHGIMESKLPPSEKTANRVFDDVSTVTAAGFETTAGALRLILFHVFDQTTILKRLRNELAAEYSKSPNGKPELKALEQLPYLTSILTEGLRLSPAIATRSARSAPDRDLYYGDWRIPAGTPVGMTTILMHTDEKIYPDPQRFNPDRWLDLEARKKYGKAFAPFSRGTRNCLGMHLAWAEMYLTVSSLVHRFDFTYESATAADFKCNSDQFGVGTRGNGVLNAIVTVHNA